MNFFQAIILGVVEGFTEFLPISSTAHLILVSKILGLAETEFLKSFTITIQLGAILAIVLLYAKKLVTDWETNKKIMVAFLPTAVIGFGLYKFIKSFLFESEGIILIALFLGGVLLVVFEKYYTKRETSDSTDATLLTYRKAFIIGCAQSLAVVPGVSRAGATIVGGMLLGLRKEVIVEFSFLLAIPTVLAATGYDLMKSANAFSMNDLSLLAFGFIFSFVSAFFGVKFLLQYIKTNSFTGFGIYRIVLALVFALYFYI